MSIVFCNRCDEEFENYKALQNHWKKVTPCDLICTDCGTRFFCDKTFKKHKKSNCEYYQKYSKFGNIEDLNRREPGQKIIKSIQPQIVKTQTVVEKKQVAQQIFNGDNNQNININIDMRGAVLPHTKEMLVDKQQLLGDIVEKVLFRMDIGKSGKANWGTMAFADSFHEMFKHIYANKDRPEYQNILLKDEETRELQIFDGTKFVDDKLTSQERMLKILHFMGDGLCWMIDGCDNYDAESKQAKKEMLGRVLTGIPRFELTYKAMFTHIFDALKDVKEDIIKRIDVVPSQVLLLPN